MSRLMTIGELSKVCRLSVKSLRNYDELGLLKPAEVDESSGYRRYAQEQITDALVIALLRSVDMPLSEVAEVLNEPPSGGTDVLRRHRNGQISQLGRPVLTSHHSHTRAGGGWKP